MRPVHRSAAILAMLAAVSSVAIAQPKAAPVKVKEDKPGLLAKAKISADSAVAIARATVAGGTISEAEIENEDGALIYSFDIKIAGKKGVEELHVDAMTGKVLKREHESPGDEKAEKRADKIVTTPPAKAKPPV
jgi:uncharacterized membrane protein YkoI